MFFLPDFFDLSANAYMVGPPTADAVLVLHWPHMGYVQQFALRDVLGQWRVPSEPEWGPVVAPSFATVSDLPDEVETCPYCREDFRAPALHDPLKKHVDYCPARPAEVEW